VARKSSWQVKKVARKSSWQVKKVARKSSGTCSQEIYIFAIRQKVENQLNKGCR
jgi:hypothetical protein